MFRTNLTTRLPAAAAFVLGLLFALPAGAAPLTATWRVVPHTQPPVLPDPSPRYDCDLWAAGGLICEFLWDEGLELRSETGLPLYGDGEPFYDAFGFDPPFKSDISPFDQLLSISSSCRAGLEPCFDTFTPRGLTVSLFAEAIPAGLFVISSKGGLVTVPGPGAGQSLAVSFSGDKWTDVTAIGIGLFLPNSCGGPEDRGRCNESGELNLTVDELRFDVGPVPEPATALLFGAGLIAALRRSRSKA